MTAWNPTQLSTLHAEHSLQLSAGPYRPGGPQAEVGMTVVGDGCSSSSRAPRPARATRILRRRLRNARGDSSVEVMRTAITEAIKADAFAPDRQPRLRVITNLRREDCTDT